MKKSIIKTAMLCALVCIFGCKPSKYIYLEDMPLDQSIPIDYQQETRIKAGDRLAISVSSTKQQLAVPFNAISYSVGTDGETTSSNTNTEGYLVDDEGFIDFPTLGRLKVGGLTMPQVKEYIKGLLIEGNHLTDAVVTVCMTNFTIYGLGALSPGKLVVPDGKINILQAVSQMGDLQSRAKYDKVRVIREEDGQRMEFDIDMTSKELFRSPAFYLQQNDIVYAEPKKRKNDSVGKTTTIVSIIAVLASLAYSITYMVR